MCYVLRVELKFSFFGNCALEKLSIIIIVIIIIIIIIIIITCVMYCALSLNLVFLELCFRKTIYYYYCYYYCYYYYYYYYYMCYVLRVELKFSFWGIVL